MRWFRRRRRGLEPLEEQLRSLRPEASRAFLESVASRIGARAPRPARRPALRYRTALAVALTAALVAAAAAEGGLGYASTATGRTASAISHVFSVSPAVQNTALTFNNENKGNNGDNNNQGNGKGDQDGDNPAGHQYVKFVYVCLHVPAHNDGDNDADDHPARNVTLFLSKAAADRLVDHGKATPGPC